MSFLEVIYDRNVLYDQVWSKAVIHVAKEYGLSDNGLRKICMKLKVPMPEAGYWAKRKHGKHVHRPPLPVYKGPDSIKVKRDIHGQLELEREELSEYKKLITFEKANKNRIVVSGTIESLHPIVERTYKSLKAAKLDSKGLVCPRAKKCIFTYISPKSIERAVAILDTLIKALESRTFQLGFLNEGRSFIIRVCGEDFVMSLEEKVRRYEKHLSAAESRQKNDWFSYRSPKYKYEATGWLELRIEGEGYGYRKRWADGKKQRLETILSSFLIGLVKAAFRIKDWRGKIERERQEWQERERQRQEEIRRRHEEEERTKNLLDQVKQWKQCSNIRAFLAALKTALNQSGVALRDDEEMREWIQWAYRKADEYDPFEIIVKSYKSDRPGENSPSS